MTGGVTLFPVWLALVGALAEVLWLQVKKAGDPLMPLSSDFVWMAPLGLLSAVAVTVAALAVLARLWRGRAMDGVKFVIPSSLVALNLLMLVPGLAHWAAAVLALGLSVQLSRVVHAHPEAAVRLMRRSAAWILLALVIAGAVISMSSRAGEARTMAARAAGRTPNVVLITLDTVRAANLSGYGYARQTTPNIDRFSQRGMVFEQALSTAPWTLPAHASLFTGRWPHELSADHEVPLDATYPTLAEYLRDRGYATAGFVANLKYCGAATGLNRGFSTYQDYSRSLGEVVSSSTLLRTVANNFRLRRLIQDDEHLNRIGAAEVSTRALDWLGTQPEAPFFIFLNYFDAHEPYLPPPPFDRQFGPGRANGRHSPLHHWLWNPAVKHQPMGDAVRQEEIDAYDGELAHLDAEVGRFLDALEQRGALENTLVVITADHGEEFAEHGVYEHGYSLYRPGVQVPLIVVPPGPTVGRMASRITTPVSARDVAATVVDVLGLADGAPFPGASLAGLWRGAEAGGNDGTLSPLLNEVTPSSGQPEWFPSSKGRMHALVHQGFRYIRNGDGSEELYDFAGDPWERTNLAAEPGRQQALVDAREALSRILAGAR